MSKLRWWFWKRRRFRGTWWTWDAHVVLPVYWHICAQYRKIGRCVNGRVDMYRAVHEVYTDHTVH